MEKNIQMGKAIILSVSKIRTFRRKVYNFYKDHGRSFPWRETSAPYHIAVSEFMLQQTQVDRVIPKYERFLEVFPDLESLATATTQDVLREWQGLGYNRRALALRNMALTIAGEHGGVIPDDPETLETLPGIGPYTARAIAVFAFNIPVILIETNIRSVYIHVFFNNDTTIHDRQILPLIEQTLDRRNPGKWYSALMDYGAMLKKNHVNPSRKSAHYTKQSRFEGSDRQLRGAVIRELTAKTSINVNEIPILLKAKPERIDKILKSLEQEGFISRTNGIIALKK
ncbi:A/G-specific adenine glycosylase [Candidatus Latescibacterota bacterium]